MQIERVSLKIILLVIAVSVFQSLKADEGMWLPFKLSLLKYQKMQSMGLEVPLDSLFNTSDPSIKDAVVSLNEGSCTGSFISTDGLLLTNHHCVLADVQWHSSVSDNYLEKGFWAPGREAELPNPGKTASVLIDASDVTTEILEQIPDSITEHRRSFLIDSISNEIIRREEAGTHYTAEISRFYEGNQFVLFLSEVFEDVRLVVSPPSSIGQFGKEEDNWMWPRHSADFALLRVYTGPDGKPAPYSDKNIPYKPKKVLPINIGGVSNNEFAMVMGYPGSTQRFLSSYGIEEIEQIINPVIKEVREIKQSIWDGGIKSNPALRIQYASKFAESSNYWKYAIGQNLVIRHRSIVNCRRQLEQRFNIWLTEHNGEHAEYEKILPSLAVIHAFKISMVKAGIVTMETLVNGFDMFSLALEGLYFKTKLESYGNDKELINQAKEELRESADEIFRNFNGELDKKVFVAMIDYYRNNLTDSLRATDKELFDVEDARNNEVLANRIYSQSVFTDKIRFDQFLANPDLEKLKTDPAVLFVTTIMENYGKYYFITEEINSQIEALMRKYIKGLMEMDPTQEFYPDANSSLRLSYGTVQPYSPRDGITYKYFTTTEGLIQKESSDPLIYQLPDDFGNLLIKKDFGKYQQADNKMPVCFISNNDITGGNSGSPVLNGRGELVGLAFDGNWEGMGSDIEYIDGLQMCVNVDVRYILFILDKYANAQWLLDEMNIKTN